MTGVRVEKRKGRLYLYARGRVDGRQTARYFGPVSQDGAELFRKSDMPTEDQLAKWDADEADEAAVAVLTAGEDFEQLADRVFREAMLSAGFTLHRRSDWRAPKRGRPMKGTTVRYERPDGGCESTPGLIRLRATDGNPKEQKTLDMARDGDPASAPGIEAMLARNPRLVDAWGTVAFFAESNLIRVAAGSDLMLAECLRRKTREYNSRLIAEAGPDPTLAEKMAATRASHNWLAVHILECRLTDHEDESRAAEALERRLSQAERRLHASLKALATLKRLRGPVLPQVRVKTTGNVLVNTAAGAIPAIAGG